MTASIADIAGYARRAVQAQDWPAVAKSADEILRHDENNAEGHFLWGLVERIQRRPQKAIQAFERVLAIDPERYDAGVELANQFSIARRNGDAAELLARYEDRLSNSPMYLDLAGTIYTEIGMPQKAWPLYEKAVELQPGVDLFRANLASCAVFLGKIEEAGESFKALLKRFPNHQRNHWQLSRLEKAKDDSHVREMQDVLARTGLPPDQNVYLYYAIGKELEDLGRWDEAFEYYRKAGDAVCSVANYDITSDLAIIDKVMEVWNGCPIRAATTYRVNRKKRRFSSSVCREQGRRSPNESSRVIPVSRASAKPSSCRWFCAARAGSKASRK
jgi:tetratricopeptide (TPR) repeat protein